MWCCDRVLMIQSKYSTIAQARTEYKLYTDDQIDRIRAHRIVLYSASDYFKKLFTSTLTEGVSTDEHNKPVFTIHGIAGDVLESFVKYCYCGKKALKFDEEHFDDTLNAATMMQFRQVQKKCVKKLKFMLENVSKCLGVWVLAQQFDLTEVVQLALDAAVWNFQKVVNKSEFLHMQLEPLKMLLSSDYINVHSEEPIFEAMAAWIDFGEEDRKGAFPELIKTIRLSQLKESVSEKRIFILFVVTFNLVLTQYLIVLYFKLVLNCACCCVCQRTWL